MAKQTLHVFDVDGTLTHHDSLLLLISYLRQKWTSQLMLWVSLLPTTVKAIIKIEPWILKQGMLNKLWKGKGRQEIEATCSIFFDNNLQADIRQKALSHIEKLRINAPSAKLVLLSASCKEWLQPLAYFLQADLICTELEYDAVQKFTGRFTTPNCKGEEKVKRLLQRYPADQYEFICYADSPSDKHLQTISKQFFYRYF